MTKKCDNCGTPAIDDQSLFCSKCGSKIPEERDCKISPCSNCGFPVVDEQSLFCNKCGTPLKNQKIEKIQIIDKTQSKAKKAQIVDTSKKYAHIPLIADDAKLGKDYTQDDKIAINKIETLPKKRDTPNKQIQETRCTCTACGKVWHYGKSEVLNNYSAKLRNAGKTMSACTCCWPMSYMSREKTDLDKCPNCGSKAVKKEQIIHDIE